MTPTITATLPSKRVAAFGVAVVIALVGVLLVVRAASRPAYEATAELVLRIPPVELPDGMELPAVCGVPRAAEIASLNHEVHAVLESPLVAERAATLLTEADPSLNVNAALIERNFRAEGRSNCSGSASVFVKYRADDPNAAREGVNAIVEAYRQVTAFASPGDLEPDWQLSSFSLAPKPTSRADTLNAPDVWRFLLVSMLAVYLTWRWWPPNPRRLVVGLVVGLLVGLVFDRPGGLLIGLIWLLALVFVIGVWPFARNLNDKLPAPK